MLTAGKHKAQLVEAGMNENGQPYMNFQIEGAGSITWFGSLTGGTPEKTQQAQEITAKSLLTAGFIGNEFSDLNKPTSEMFKPTEVELVIEEETYKGKSRLKVKFVNAARKPKRAYVGQVPRGAALFNKMRSELGVTKPAKTPIASEPQDDPF